MESPSRRVPIATPCRKSDSRWCLTVGSPSLGLILVGIGIIAVLVRLTLVFRAPAFIIADSDNYFYPGFQFARGLGFDLDFRRTPGYPLFIAATIWLAGEKLTALVFAQHALGVVSSLLIAWLGHRLYGPWAGLTAGLMVAVGAPLLIAEQYVMAEALFIPFLVVTVAVLALALETRSASWMLLGGALVGLSALIRPVGFGVAVALAAALLIRDRSLRGAVRSGLPALIGLALVVVPWMGRNAVVHGSFTPDGNAGQTLVGRTMRHDRGFSFENPNDPDPGRQRAREIMRAGRGSFVSPVRERIMRELGLDEPGANRLMRELALEAILRQPGYYLGGTLSGFARLAQGFPERTRDHWATRRESRNREEWEGRPEIKHLLGPPTPLHEAQYADVELVLRLYQPARFGPMVAILAVIGAVALARRQTTRATGVFLTLVVLGMLVLSVALVAPLPRYRYPVEPIIALLAAGGLVAVLRLFGDRIRWALGRWRTSRVDRSELDIARAGTGGGLARSL